MPNRTASITPEFQSLNDSLVQLEREPSFALALKTISTITGFLGIPTLGTERLYNVDKIKQNPGWFVSADGFADRRACYKLAEDNTQNLDIKVYWIQKTSKRIISSAVMFTPNFEDEPFNVDLKVGIDFFIPPSADRIIIALSNRYLIRTLELSGSLSLTQQEIFTKWIQKFDFSNKAQAHQVLWESLDLQPLNKQFYKEVTRFFTELIQHLETDTNLFQSKEAAQFTNRLVGRLIFCWFLRKKQIIADDRAYFEIDESIDSSAYYHNRLEKLFFSILNTKIEERNEEDKTTPFLNGGLFEAKQTDHRANKDLTFPKDYFHRFFQFLDGYNFTTDESTSEFQQVAIDPEMLGRIFENLLAEQTEETGQQARKAKGAFYTPREIVDYMCKESLREYVRTRLPDDNKRDHVLELLFDKKEHQFDYSNYRADIQPYKKNILDALDEITILDPACGSGAFPMGMLQLMLSLYERIDARFDSYKTKLGIVKNNLFGVDIEPMAVEISRLRAWLSIIVDVDMNPTKENLGIEPLPNLEFKFVAANSLIPLETGGTDQMEFDNKNLQEEMSRIRDRYFNTNSGKVKEKMKLDYEKLLCSGNTMFKSDRQKKLLTYHPFDSSKSAGFFDPKVMFGLEGFDVVIGNPPYVQVSKNLFSSERFPYSQGKDKGKQNLYKVFIEHSYNQSKIGGLVCLITQNSLMADISAEFTRELLLTKTMVMKIIEFPKLVQGKQTKVFEGVLQGTCVILFKKENPGDDQHFLISTGNSRESLNNLKFERVTQNGLLKSYPSGKYFPLIKEGYYQIIVKMMENNCRLKDYFKESQKGDFNLGIYKAKIISSETSIKLYRGRQVHRYRLGTQCDEYMVEGFKKESIEKNLKHQYILSQNITGTTDERRLHFCLTRINEKFLCGDSINKILLNDEAQNVLFLGLLNSKLLDWLFRCTSTNNHVNGYELEALPIPHLSSAKNDLIKEIQSLVHQLISSSLEKSEANKLDVQIDDLVMDLYHLSEEEKEIIRNS